MKKVISLFTLFTVSFLLVQCKTIENKQEFTTFSEQYFKDKNELNPVEATQYGQNEYNDQLQFEMTDDYRKKQSVFFEKYEFALTTTDEKQLSEEEKNSFEIIRWEVKIGKELLKQPTNLMPFSQFDGTHLEMGRFAGGTSAQPFKTNTDYTNFLTRLDKYSVWIDSSIVYMRKGIAKGVVLPKAITKKIIPQFEGMPTTNVEDNLFYSAIKLMPATFSEEVKKDLTEKYVAIINKKLVPQYQKMTAFLKNEYLPASRTSSGIGSMPFGEDLYRIYTKQWTTTELSPDEIHNLGMKEVARINIEMEKVKNEVGFKGSLNDFFLDVRNKPELKPFKKPEEVIANFEKIYARVKPNVDKLFSLQPKSKFEVRRTEAFREKTASASYSQGAEDGSRPGIFYVPIPDVKKYNTNRDEDLFLHEAIPGHHFQISIQQESTTLPKFRKFNWFGAYGEGWALYTESLGKELGMYQDPYQYLGMLDGEMHRAIRLVVDTGIHSKNWTREQAIQFSLDNEARSKDVIIPEIERYMARPGQALSYKIGQLKILELRKKAETTMGVKFDIKKFHEKVLESGVMPLALLEMKIDKWIKESK
jgi:uncharacterized protein (DUF885 family)